MRARSHVVAALLWSGTTLGSPGAAHAGGFYVPEIGPAAVGTAGAMTALGEDTSAIFHNPAGLADLPAMELQLSAAMFLPDVSYYRRPVVDPLSGDTLYFDRVENENSVETAPYLGYAQPITRDLTAGVALFAPFGATIDYPTKGAQRQVVTGLRLRAVSLSPAVAMKLPAGFRVGAAVNLIFSDIRIGQANALTYVTGDPELYPDPDVALEGSTLLEGRDPFSVTATLGAQWVSPDSRLRIGLSLLTPVTLELEGQAKIQNEGIVALMDDDGTMLQPEGQRTDDVRMEIPLPLIARAGVAYAATPRLQLILDVNWQRWSTFEKLTVDFANEHELLPTPGAYLYDVTVVNDWRDTFSVRTGAQWRPRSGAGWTPRTVRFGAVFDQSPVDDRHFGLLAPDSDKLGVSTGLAWRVEAMGERFDLDLAYMHLFLRERDVAPAADGTPGSDGTILNKPAPSFFEGVTRAAFDIVYVAVSWRR